MRRLAKKRSTLVLAILAIVTLGAVLVVAGAVWFYTTAFERMPADQAAAQESFARVRTRFGDATPLFAMGPAGPTLNRQRPPARAATQLRNVHVLAWDPEDERLAHVTIPFWLVRLRPGTMSVAAPAGDVRLSISADELESYGSALLLDHTDEDGERTLIWTE